jgi:uncharacterized protein (DUF433 family)
MQVELESYFDFVSPEDIRIKDTRIGIEFVLRDYQGGASPEEIVLRYPTLSLEQVHATITYYLHHRRSVEAYLARWWAQGEAAWEEQQRHPSEFVRNLQERVEKQQQKLQSKKIPNPVST